MMYSESIKTLVHDQGLPFAKLSGKNVLVTGATGLIGSSIIDALINCEIVDFNLYVAGRSEMKAKERFNDYWDHPNLHFFRYDALNPIDSDVDFHYIIHAASNASPVAFSTQPVEVMKSNLIGLCNLLDYGIMHNLERLLFISSGEVYGQGEGGDFDEKYSGYVDPVSSRSCYPSSKRAAETLCASYSDEYGLDIVIARPCHIYGPRFTDNDNRAYAQFLRNAINGEDIVLKSDGSQFRSWCYVVDCASALLYILMKGQSGLAYNIAESGYSIKDLAETIASVCGKQVKYSLPSSSESKGYNRVTRSILTTERIKFLGWTPRFNLHDGIVDSINDLTHFNL